MLFLQKSKSFRKKSTGDLTTIDNNNKNSKCNRIFLVEAPCAMSPPQLPLSAKPRHLFLFSDLLLVAKPRSGGTFKLKVALQSNVLVSKLILIVIGKRKSFRTLVGALSRIRHRFLARLASTSPDIFGYLLHTSSQRLLVEGVTAGFSRPT